MPGECDHGPVGPVCSTEAIKALMDRAGQESGGIDVVFNNAGAGGARESIAEIDAAGRKALSTDDLVYVVVGDAAVVKPQLDGLGLPVETVSLDN